MNKKAFTLIEILAVIVIIALILVLVTPNILANLSKARGKVSDATEKVITEAANIYLDENPDPYPENEGDIYCITVDTLMGAGKLVNPLTDAATGKEISGSTSVRVTITKGGREFELVTDGTCDQGNLDILTSKDIELKVSNITTKGFDVTTRITKSDYNISNIDKYDYSIDNGKKYDYKNKGTLTRVTNLLTNTYTVKVKVTTKDGQVVVGSQSVKVTLNEITAPVPSSVPSMNVCASEKTITVKNPVLQMKNQSGDAARVDKIKNDEKLIYSYTTNTALNKNSWTRAGSSTYSFKVYENGTLMARVTDGVNEKIVSYAITKVDNPNPVILKATVDLTKEKWYAGRITVTARTSVCTNSSSIKINGYCLTTTNSRPAANNSCFNNTGSSNHYAHNNNSFGRDNGTYYAWARDTDGKVSLKGVKVTVNWKGVPRCSIDRTGKYVYKSSKWWTGNVTATLKPTVDNGKTIRSKSISANGSSSSTKITISKEGKSIASGSVSAGGKTGKCSYTAWIDKTKPSCYVSSYKSNVSSPWVKFRCSDSTSGCQSSGTTKYGGGTHYYTCYDNAGNKSSTSKYVKRYVPPPPPPYSGGSSGGSGGGSSSGGSTNKKRYYVCNSIQYTPSPCYSTKPLLTGNCMCCSTKFDFRRACVRRTYSSSSGSNKNKFPSTGGFTCSHHNNNTALCK